MIQTNISSYVRETSKQAYKELLDELGERQRLVLAVIQKYPGMTDRELTRLLNVSDPNFVRPRRNELVKMGWVVEGDKKVCSISRKKVLTWSLEKK